MARTGKGSAPGTAGELVQGLTSTGEHFHVTAPINLRSDVTVYLDQSSWWFFTGVSKKLTKISASVQATAELLGAGPFAVYIDRHTKLPEGRGMGSSTADIIAAARATADALHETLTAEQEAQIAISIESSDGLMHPGIVAFGQHTGTVLDQYGWTPRMDIVLTIPARCQETEAVDLSGYTAHMAEFDGLLATLRWAAETQDGTAFAFAATRSAELNQAVNPNPQYLRLSALSEDLGADGVIVGHTGTVAGLIYLGGPAGLASIAATVAEEIPADVSVQVVTVAGS